MHTILCTVKLLHCMCAFYYTMSVFASLHAALKLNFRVYEINRMAGKLHLIVYVFHMYKTHVK